MEDRLYELMESWEALARNLQRELLVARAERDEARRLHREAVAVLARPRADDVEASMALSRSADAGPTPALPALARLADCQCERLPDGFGYAPSRSCPGHGPLMEMLEDAAAGLAQASLASEPATERRRCKQCLVQFRRPVGSGEAFCSEECRRDRRPPDGEAQRRCVVCDGALPPGRRRAYCSEECRRQRDNAKDRAGYTPRAYQQKPCGWPGGLTRFQPSGPRALYCELHARARQAQAAATVPPPALETVWDGSMGKGA